MSAFGLAPGAPESTYITQGWNKAWRSYDVQDHFYPTLRGTGGPNEQGSRAASTATGVCTKRSKNGDEITGRWHIAGRFGIAGVVAFPARQNATENAGVRCKTNTER
jgi:hypothetical protein